MINYRFYRSKIQNGAGIPQEMTALGTGEMFNEENDT